MEAGHPCAAVDRGSALSVRRSSIRVGFRTGFRGNTRVGRGSILRRIHVSVRPARRASGARRTTRARGTSAGRRSTSHHTAAARRSPPAGGDTSAAPRSASRAHCPGNTSAGDDSALTVRATLRGRPPGGDRAAEYRCPAALALIATRGGTAGATRTSMTRRTRGRATAKKCNEHDRSKRDWVCLLF